MKASVQIAVFCGPERTNWINPELALFFADCSVLSATGQRKVDMTYIMGARPHDCARNRAVKEFLGYDWLLMIDNDQAVGVSIFDMLDAATDDMHIVVPRNYMLSNADPRNLETSLVWWNGSQPEGEWIELKQAGSGIMGIRREVFTRIPRPCFQFEYDADGITRTGEDQYFCRKVRDAGMRIWGNMKHMGRHYHSAEVGSIALMTGRANAGNSL